MENVILKVTLNDGGSLNTLAQLDKSVAALNGKNIQIKMDIKGIQALNDATLKSLSAVAKEENARARLIVAQTKQAKLQNDIAVAQEKTKQAAQKTRQEQEKGAQAQEKTMQAQTRLATEEQKGANIEQQRALLAEKMAAQYDRAAMAADKLSGSGAVANEAGTAPTNMQKRIDGMVGLGAATKSAADSASIFNAVHSSMGNQIVSFTPKLAQGTATMRQHIRSLDGMAKATVKANGITNVAGNSFQTYTATVKNADGSFQNYKYSVDAATGATFKMEKGVSSVNNAATHAGDTIGNLVLKVAKWAAITTLVYAPIRAFKEAVAELKNVDTELVTIQKVTNMTADQMDALAASAYGVAKAYGSTASGYLASVSEFAKAGYTDLSDSLGQLALKTQVVGDTDQRTANQFLLSVDAAYKYKGSIDKLNAVLDGANQIGNEYATNVQKIAEGLGVVSSVAASAHTDVSELSAAIGTITAVSQRSGTEAARSIRAIFLNILGNTEITLDEESDEKWTADEILAMQDALVKFNIATRETVEGVEQLRNPMKVIGDIAKQREAGLISEADLNGLIQDLGGKLRSNQLLALIDNWDMYEKMLATYQSAAGSADKEFDIYLNSWEAKLNQLSAAWTEFVSEFGIEDAIKKILDLGATLLDVANGDMGQAAVKLAALSVAVMLLTKSFAAAKTTIAASKFAAELLLTMDALRNGATFANASFALLNRTLLASPLFWAIAPFAIMELIDALTVDFDDQQKRVQALNGELEELTGKYSALSSRSASELTENDRHTLLLLDMEIAEKKKQLAEAQQQEYRLFSKKISPVLAIDSAGDSYFQSQSETMEKTVKNYREFLQVQGESYEQQEKLDTQQGERMTAMIAYATALQDYKNSGVALNATDAKLLASILELTDAQGDAADAAEQSSAAQRTASTTAAALKSRYELLKKAQEEADESGKISAATLEMLTSRYPELSKYLLQTADGYVLTRGALEEFIKAEREEYELALNNAQTAAQSVIDAEALKREGIDATTLSIRGQLIAMAALYQSQFVARRIAEGDTAGEATRSFEAGNDSAEYRAYSAVYSALQQLEGAQQNRYDFDKAATSLRSGGLVEEKDKNSPSPDKKAKAATLLEKLQAQMADEEHRIFLMEKQGNQETAMVERYRKMQERVHTVANQYRAKGYRESSDEIQSLQKMYWEYADDIKGIYDGLAKAQEAAWSELEDYVDGVLKKAADARDDQLDAIDAQIAAQKKQQETADAQLTLEEKRLAVEQARQALLTAQNERTIREIHADGSWEWIADKGAVDKAQELLGSARDELDEYREQLAHKAVLDELEAEKEHIKAQYDAFDAQWTALKDALKTPSRDISDILSDIAQNGTPAMKAAIDSVTGMLGGLSSYLGGAMGKPEERADEEGGGGGGYHFNDSSYDPDRDYHNDMLHATTRDEFEELAERREDKINSEGITGVKSNEEIYREWQAAHSFDSGGVAHGKGTMAKATAADELVLAPELTERILNPERGARFSRFSTELASLLDSAEKFSGRGAFTANKNAVSDNHSINYFLNGVKIGADQLHRPFGDVLATLGIHTEF